MNENLWCITFCYRRNCCSCYWMMKSIVHFLSLLFYNSHTLSLQNMTHRSPRFCRKSELVNLFNGCLFFLYKQLRHMRMFIMLITSQNMPYFIDLKGFFYLTIWESIYFTLRQIVILFSNYVYRIDVLNNLNSSVRKNKGKGVFYRGIDMILVNIGTNARACECIVKPTTANIHQYQFNKLHVTSLAYS